MKIIICDDERNIVEKYKKVLENIFSENKIQGTIHCVSGKDGLLFAMGENPNEVDLVLMDIHLTESVDGIDLSKLLREKSYENDIVFLTKDQSKVFDSFDAEPLYFFVKQDISLEKLEKVILKSVKRAREKSEEMITFSCAGEIRNIDICRIDYFEVDRRIIIVHYGNEFFEFYSTLGKLENILDSKGFIRTH